MLNHLPNTLIMANKKTITTNSGSPVNHYQDSQSVGAEGPLLLQDYFLHEKLAQFNRERIPERIVHAKGSGAYGKFTVTHDISKYSRAKLFGKIGKETKVFARFSTVGGEKAQPIPKETHEALRLSFTPKTATGIW